VFIGYWRDVLRIAWRETWAFVMGRTPANVFRDILLLAITGIIVWCAMPVLIRDRLMSGDSLKDSLAWAIFVAISTVGLFAAVFVCESLFVAPYQKWRDKKETTGEGRALRLLVSSRDRFTLEEAACLIAGVDIQQEDLRGIAAAYLYDIRKKVLRGELKVLNDISGQVEMTRSLQRMPFGGNHKELRAGLEISKADFTAIARRLDVSIPGLTS